MVTIRDVALRAGVSPSTVSYVLTGNKKLSPDTEARVRASIEELKYRPHAAARALSLGRNGVIGLLVRIDWHRSETDSDILMRFVRSALFAAQRHGSDLMIMGGLLEERTSDPLVDALVVMDVETRDPRLPGLRRRGLPTVLVGMPQDTLGLSAVDLDFEQAAVLALSHLAALGHTSVAVLLSCEEGELSFVERFQDGVERAGQELSLSTYCGGSADGDADVEVWLREAIDALSVVSAMIIVNVGALEALQRLLRSRGMSMPGDVSVVVLAPDERMAILHPTITIIDLPGQEMMERAVGQALHELAGEPCGVKVLLDPRLIDRGSTGPAGVGVRGG